MRCTYYCTADSYDIDSLSKHFRDLGSDPKFYDNVVNITQGRGEIFYFSYGCVVFWGFSEDEEERFLEELVAFSRDLLPVCVRDMCSYVMGQETVIEEEDDQIILELEDPLIKLSLSHGLSQSVKLGAFEAAIDETIAKTRHLPADLATRGKTSLSRKQLSQEIGALFAQRNSINLHSDIMDTPEFFWRRPRYEPYYHMAHEYMDIKTRVDILNKRLDVIHELYNILSDELKHVHSSRLEMVIILLIVSEVIMHLLKDILKWI